MSRPERSEQPPAAPNMGAHAPDSPVDARAPDLQDQARAPDSPVPAQQASDQRAPARQAPAPPLPLQDGERPVALLVAVAVCAALALAVIVGAASIHDLSRHGGSLPGAVFLAAVLTLLAQGMYRRRYWAVLSFEALVAFQILVTSLALVVSSTIIAAGSCLVSIGLAGWLFWKLVRVMARIQAAERPPV